MTDWFRSWHGAPTDPKWLVIARKAGVAPGVVSAVVWALFDHASQQSPRGDVSGFDAETYAAFSGFEQSEVDAIVAALCDKGLIKQGVLSAWEKRQPSREDGSAERAKAWRERTRTQANATEREQPQPNATEPHREEKIRTDKKDSDSVAGAPDRSAFVQEVGKLFEEFWAEYPRRQGANPKEPAMKSFLRQIVTGRKGEYDVEAVRAIVGGAKRYAAELRNQGKTETPFVARAVTFLNERRWRDYPEVAEAAPTVAGKFHAKAESPELAAWDRWSRHTRGKPMLRDRAGGWLVDSQWPPEVEPPDPHVKSAHNPQGDGDNCATH